MRTELPGSASLNGLVAWQNASIVSNDSELETFKEFAAKTDGLEMTILQMQATLDEAEKDKVVLQADVNARDVEVLRLKAELLKREEVTEKSQPLPRERESS